jgi:hypothetical protein
MVLVWACVVTSGPEAFPCGCRGDAGDDLLRRPPRPPRLHHQRLGTHDMIAQAPSCTPANGPSPCMSGVVRVARCRRRCCCPTPRPPAGPPSRGSTRYRSALIINYPTAPCRKCIFGFLFNRHPAPPLSVVGAGVCSGPAPRHRRHRRNGQSHARRTASQASIVHLAVAYSGGA